MQPHKLLSFITLFAIGAQALPSLPKANSPNVRTDVDEASKGAIGKPVEDWGRQPGGKTAKRTDAVAGWGRQNPNVAEGARIEKRADTDEA